MAGPVAGPTVVRRQLGRRLKRLRDGKGVSVDEVARNRQLGLSRAKIYKLEQGVHPAKPQDVTVLCRFYGCTNDEIDVLTALAVATQERSWWHVYGGDAVPEWFSLYADVEPAARSIRTYEAELVPGLLQTREYAEEIYRARNPDHSTEELERRISVRMDRQAILDRQDPPALHVILNEAVLLREVGGPKVMDTQRHKLRQAAARSNITIEVVPLSAGAHASMETSFVVLDFPDPETDPSFVYLDSPSSAAYLQEQVELDRYTTIFNHVRSRSAPLE